MGFERKTTFAKEKEKKIIQPKNYISDCGSIRK